MHYQSFTYIPPINYLLTTYQLYITYQFPNCTFTIFRALWRTKLVRGFIFFLAQYLLLLTRSYRLLPLQVYMLLYFSETKKQVLPNIFWLDFCASCRSEIPLCGKKGGKSCNQYFTSRRPLQ